MIITLPVENYSDIYQDKSCCQKQWNMWVLERKELTRGGNCGTR